MIVVKTILMLINQHIRTAMQKSNNLPNIDMVMIRIQALEWVQSQIQDLILDNVTADWPVMVNEDNDEQLILEHDNNN